MYAVISSGGKQYRLSEGDLIDLERLDGEVGDQVVFDQVLLVSNGEAPLIGTPTVDGARVVGTIVEQGKGDKIVVFKFKRRKMYRRRTGHRQLLTSVKIESIETAGPAKAKTKKATASVEEKKVEKKAAATVEAKTAVKAGAKKVEKVESSSEQVEKAAPRTKKEKKPEPTSKKVGKAESREAAAPKKTAKKAAASKSTKASASKKATAAKAKSAEVAAEADTKKSDAAKETE